MSRKAEKPQLDRANVEKFVNLCNESKSTTSRFAIMGAAGPILEALEADAEVPDGILDLFPQDARRTMLILLTTMLLKAE